MSSSSSISAGGGIDKRKVDKISTTSPRSNRLEESRYLMELYKWKYITNSVIYEKDGSYVKDLEIKQMMVFRKIWRRIY